MDMASVKDGMSSFMKEIGDVAGKPFCRANHATAVIRAVQVSAARFLRRANRHCHFSMFFVTFLLLNVMDLW
jgi:hypothetical protein